MKTTSCHPIFQGKTLSDIARDSGLSTTSVWRHAHGKLKISAESALKYNKALGIPLSAMRPDLWPPELEAAASAISDA